MVEVADAVLPDQRRISEEDQAEEDKSLWRKGVPGKKSGTLFYALTLSKSIS
ncbi:hypothetical protein MARINOS108_10761 [Marinoscillum sp. 108]|nr:hypothetical protein MARINOS108_10761 [Marinoscillum sp. 108]